MQIAGRKISSEFPPFLIAEISCNHMGKLDLAHKLIDAAKNAGADAVKTQCYTADDMTIDCDKPDFVMKDGPWKGRKLYELYAKAGTPRDWFPALFAHGKKIGITVFASVFSPEGVDFLEELDCPCYKIASMEITDIPLIKHAARTGKPLIISTGMASADDIFNATKAAGKNFSLLSCVSSYPAAVEETDLTGIGDWTDGISDHSPGSDIPIAATVLGATIIEKHLKLDRYYPKGDRLIDIGKPEDDAFSMRPCEFSQMAKSVRQVWQALNKDRKRPESEESTRQARRSLYVVKDMKVGDTFTRKNVRSIRPAYGLPPVNMPQVLGCKALVDIEAGTALRDEMLDWLPF